MLSPHSRRVRHIGLVALLLSAGLAAAADAPATPFVQVTEWRDGDWSARVTHRSAPDPQSTFTADALPADGQPAPAWGMRFKLEPANDERQSVLGALLLHKSVYAPATSGPVASVTVSDAGRVVDGRGRIVCRIAVVQDGRVYTSLNENFERAEWTARSAGPLQAKDFGELDPDSPRGDMNRRSNPDFSAKGAPMQFGIWRMLRTTRAAGLAFHEAIDNWTVTLQPGDATSAAVPAVEVDDRLRELTAEQQRGYALDALRRFDRDYDERRYLDRNDNRTLIWNESKLLQGYAWAFEAGGDRAYADRLFAHAREIWARRSDRQGVSDEIRGRSMPAWCTDHYTAPRQHAMLAGAGMLTFPMLHAAYLAQRDPRLAADYADVSRVAVREAIETLDAFDDVWRDGPGAGEGYYKDFRGVDAARARVLMDGLRDGPDAGLYVEPYDVLPLPFNMQNAAGRSYVMLWLLTGEARFRQRAERLATFFRNRLRIDGDAFVWAYGVHRGIHDAEDTSHAGLNVEFVVLCHRAGLVFSDQDLARFAATAKRISFGANGLRSYIDGSDRQFRREPMLYGWLGLGVHDHDFRLRALAWYDQDWSSGGSRGGQAAAGALAAGTLAFAPWTPLSSPLPAGELVALPAARLP